MSKKRLFQVFGLGTIFILYYLFVHFTGMGIPCFYRTCFGLKCPGCGITNMYLAIFELRFRDAFHENPVIFIAQPLIYFEVGKLVYSYVFNKKVNTGRFESICLYFFIVTLVAFGFIRNIPTIMGYLSRFR